LLQLHPHQSTELTLKQIMSVRNVVHSHGRQTNQTLGLRLISARLQPRNIGLRHRSRGLPSLPLGPRSHALPLDAHHVRTAWKWRGLTRGEGKEEGHYSLKLSAGGDEPRAANRGDGCLGGCKSGRRMRGRREPEIWTRHAVALRPVDPHE